MQIESNIPDVLGRVSRRHSAISLHTAGDSHIERKCWPAAIDGRPARPRRHESEEALAEAMRQAQRYGEDPADFAGQPRVSFRVDAEHVNEYR
jgi:hypothetical protein